MCYLYALISRSNLAKLALQPLTQLQSKNQFGDHQKLKSTSYIHVNTVQKTRLSTEFMLHMFFVFVFFLTNDGQKQEFHESTVITWHTTKFEIIL